MTNFIHHFTTFKTILEKKEKLHTLSGVVLILDNKILLVNPKKFQGVWRKWSIPKGHEEDHLTSLQSAIKELEEEANITLSEERFDKATKDSLEYQKGSALKILDYYVLKITHDDLPFKLYNDMILRYFLKKGEICEAGFFTKEEALDLIEPGQAQVLKYL
jgi:8-oxo-dGTP pyrophosphatase MutT (NUDIX family)